MRRGDREVIHLTIYNTYTFSRVQCHSLRDQLGRGGGGGINRYAKRHKIRRQVDISDYALTDLCVTWI